MEAHLKVIGSMLILLALLHAFFPRYFNWATEAASLKLLTRQLLYVHTFFIALTLFLSGLLCLTCARELLRTMLGHRILLGMGCFTVARLSIQFGGYSSKLWRGKRVETMIHLLFIVFWTYLSIVFLWAGFA